MYEYESHVKATGTEVIKRINPDGSESWIPVNEDNIDYLVYVGWLFEGNEPKVVQVDDIMNEAQTEKLKNDL